MNRMDPIVTPERQSRYLESFSGFVVGVAGVLLLMGIVLWPPVLASLFELDNGFSAGTSFNLAVTSGSLVFFAGILVVLRRKRIGVRIAMVGSGFVVALFISETIIRVLVPQPGHRTADQSLHHTLRPNESGAEAWGGVRVEYYTNSLGFRDRQVRTVEKHFDGLRLLILGDSFAEGIGIDYDSTVAGRLPERIRAAPGRTMASVEVLNAGVSGYSPKLEARRLNRFFDQGYATDIVILFADLSDLRNEGIDYRSWDSFSPKEVRTINRGAAFRRMLLPRIIPFVRRGVGSLLSQGNHAPEPFHVVPPSRLSEQKRDSLLYSDSLTGWKADGLRLMEEETKRIADDAESHGADFFLLIYPHPQQVAALQSGDERGMGADVYRARLRSFAKANAIPLLDLFPAFVEDPEAAKRFILGDVHWSESGNRVVADTLARFLLSRIHDELLPDNNRTALD